MRAIHLLGFLLLAGAAPLAAAVADQIKARQANFKQLGRDYKALGDEIKRGSPNPGIVKARAAAVAAAASRIPRWFPPGSGPEAGVKTAAKAEIWRRVPDFKAKAAGLRAEAGKMARLAGGGDRDAMAAQLKAVGARCKACHTDYREED